MAEQDPKPGFLSFSTLGSPIVIDSSDTANPTKIHEVNVAADGNAEQVFLKVHNNKDERVDFWMRVHPVADSAQAQSDAAMKFTIPACSTMVVLDGEIFKEFVSPPSAATRGITIWTDVAADATNEELKAFGWVIDIADPIVN